MKRLLPLFLLGCEGPADDVRPTGDCESVHFDALERGPLPAGPTNILLVIADDVGMELTSTFGVHPEAAPTPTLDTLAAEGVRFDQAWADGWCSPTRATIATGRYGHRYGIGRAIRVRAEATGLPYEETTIAELLADYAPDEWQTAVFGKWHLDAIEHDAVNGPANHGFGWHQGTVANLMQENAIDGEPQGYWNWEKVENGEVARVDRYATTELVDDAIAWLDTAEEPWLAWTAFQSAHTPVHVPPEELHSYDLSEAGDPGRVRAMVESMDTELGRLLDSLEPEVRARTTVIWIGDNGSAQGSRLEDYEDVPVKASIYEGGVHVPLVISGPLVHRPGRTSEALVNSTDLFSTIAEIAGIQLGDVNLELDSVSVLPLVADAEAPDRRLFTYAENFEPNGFGPYDRDARAVRNSDYKLVLYPDAEELYDLRDTLLEGEDLLLEDGLDSSAERALQSLHDVFDVCVPRSAAP